MYLQGIRSDALKEWRAASLGACRQRVWKPGAPFEQALAGCYFYIWDPMMHMGKQHFTY
jgi:hypothetical protein